MTDPERTLSAIDAAIDGWTERDRSVGADAMRWAPVPPAQQSHQGPVHYGTVTLAVTANTRAFAEAVERINRQWKGLRTAFMAIGRAVSKHQSTFHIVYAPAIYGDGYRRHRRRCRLCNPAGNPQALKVNGADYARRRKNRRRRGR